MTPFPGNGDVWQGHLWVNGRLPSGAYGAPAAPVCLGGGPGLKFAIWGPWAPPELPTCPRCAVLLDQALAERIG